MKIIAQIVGLLVIILAVSGCEGLVERAENSDALSEYLIERQTLEYIDDGEGVVDQARVSRLYSRVNDVRRYVDMSESVTVALLEGYINERVPWDEMTLSEARDARLLISVVAEAVSRRVDARGGDTRIVVGFFVDTVANTLDRYR